jgi:hypothetical protein
MGAISGSRCLKPMSNQWAITESYQRAPSGDLWGSAELCLLEGVQVPERRNYLTTIRKQTSNNPIHSYSTKDSPSQVTTTPKIEKLKREIEQLDDKLTHLEAEHKRLVKERNIQGKFGQKQKLASELDSDIKRVIRRKRDVVKKRKATLLKLKKLEAKAKHKAETKN